MVHSKITIGYTYYNNSVGWEIIQQKYKDCPHDLIIVDDASPDPIKVNDRWTTYKINEDIGWNNEGARNLIVQEAKTDWVALIDMDWYLEDFDIDLSVLDKDSMYHFFCPEAITWKGKSYDHNQILVHRDHFLKLGGYWTNDKGWYGLDGTIKTKYKFLGNIKLLPHKLRYNFEGDTNYIESKQLCTGDTIELIRGIKEEKNAPKWVVPDNLLEYLDLKLPFSWEKL